MSRRLVAVLTLFLAVQAALVHGRPPRFPPNEGKDLLETVQALRVASSSGAQS